MTKTSIELTEVLVALLRVHGIGPLEIEPRHADDDGTRVRLAGAYRPYIIELSDPNPQTELAYVSLDVDNSKESGGNPTVGYWVVGPDNQTIESVAMELSSNPGLQPAIVTLN